MGKHEKSKPMQAIMHERYPISTVEEVLQDFNQSTVFKNRHQASLSSYLSYGQTTVPLNAFSHLSPSQAPGLIDGFFVYNHLTM